MEPAGVNHMILAIVDGAMVKAFTEEEVPGVTDTHSQLKMIAEQIMPAFSYARDADRRIGSGDEDFAAGSARRTFALVAATPATAFTLDPSLSGGGLDRIPVGDRDYSRADGLAVMGDGRTVIGGLAKQGDRTLGGLLRLLPDGEPDPSFAAGTSFPGQVLVDAAPLDEPDKRTIIRDLLVAADGSIWVSGDISKLYDEVFQDYTRQPFVAHVLADGTLDPAIQEAGYQPGVKPLLDAGISAIQLLAAPGGGFYVLGNVDSRATIDNGVGATLNSEALHRHQAHRGARAGPGLRRRRARAARPHEHLGGLRAGLRRQRHGTGRAEPDRGRRPGAAIVFRDRLPRALQRRRPARHRLRRRGRPAELAAGDPGRGACGARHRHPARPGDPGRHRPGHQQLPGARHPTRRAHRGGRPGRGRRRGDRDGGPLHP